MSHLLKPNWPQLPDTFLAYTTLRTGGVSRAPYDDGSGLGGFNLGDHVDDRSEDVVRNRAVLAESLPNHPQWLFQVHSATVLNFDEQQTNLTADACVTSQPNVVCAVLTADCLPVLFCDPKQGVVAAAHAGWRGLANGVLENTVAEMRKSGANSEHILVWLGPAIGPSKFEVGAEVHALFVQQDMSFAEAFTPSQSQSDKFYADIYQLARLRLLRAGVNKIAGGEFCTVSEPDKFYSYRRDGVTGRMATLIFKQSR